MSQKITGLLIILAALSIGDWIEFNHQAKGFLVWVCQSCIEVLK